MGTADIGSPHDAWVDDRHPDLALHVTTTPDSEGAKSDFSRGLGWPGTSGGGLDSLQRFMRGDRAKPGTVRVVAAPACTPAWLDPTGRGGASDPARPVGGQRPPGRHHQGRHLRWLTHARPPDDTPAPAPVMGASPPGRLVDVLASRYANRVAPEALATARL